ncbi:MAG: hypothetical protein RIR33_3867 [Pseudomonadota bacterium]
MAGFRNHRAWTDAEIAGQFHITSFRKAVSSTATTTNAWIDYSYFPGSPVANFYASEPLAAAYVEASRGIYVPTVSPKTQWLRNLKLMSAASSATSTTNGRQQIVLADLLMYYPFVDTDAVGEQQDMINDVTLPRYTSGNVIAVGQSAASTTGQFTFSYTNQDGTAGRTSQNHFTFAVAGGGQVVASSVQSATSYHPYLSLQAGDSGVRSIQSVTFTAGGGGLMALVIVKPLLECFVTQEARRTTSGNLETYGACDEFASMIHHRPRQIVDGAVVNLFAAGHAGSLASSILAGMLETTWN